MIRVVFCGVGALGSGAVVLCRSLPAELVLIDGDRVASKNLAAQAYVKQSVGKNKAEALRLQLANFYGLKVEARGVRLREDNCAELLAGAGLLVDCFDNQASRQLLSRHAAAAGVPLVHAALSGDGTFGMVRWDARFQADAEDEPGQATCEGGEHLPLIGLCCAAVARAVQDFVRAGEARDLMITLAEVRQTFP